jgi:hypothetical protein
MYEIDQPAKFSSTILTTNNIKSLTVINNSMFDFTLQAQALNNSTFT